MRLSEHATAVLRLAAALILAACGTSTVWAQQAENTGSQYEFIRDFNSLSDYRRKYDEYLGDTERYRPASGVANSGPHVSTPYGTDAPEFDVVNDQPYGWFRGNDDDSVDQDDSDSISLGLSLSLSPNNPSQSSSSVGGPSFRYRAGGWDWHSESVLAYERAAREDVTEPGPLPSQDPCGTGPFSCFENAVQDLPCDYASGCVENQIPDFCDDGDCIGSLVPECDDDIECRSYHLGASEPAAQLHGPISADSNPDKIDCKEWCTSLPLDIPNLPVDYVTSVEVCKFPRFENCGNRE